MQVHSAQCSGASQCGWSEKKIFLRDFSLRHCGLSPFPFLRVILAFAKIPRLPKADCEILPKFLILLSNFKLEVGIKNMVMPEVSRTYTKSGPARKLFHLKDSCQ